MGVKLWREGTAGDEFEELERAWVEKADKDLETPE